MDLQKKQNLAANLLESCKTNLEAVSFLIEENPEILLDSRMEGYFQAIDLALLEIPYRYADNLEEIVKSAYKCDSGRFENLKALIEKIKSKVISTISI